MVQKKDNNKVKVSVILPCWNVADCMDKMFDSLKSQTLKNIEIICVDDKSTDKTLDKIKDFATQDERIVIYPLKKNTGVAHARNFGLSKAHGEYVCFLDPDDYIDNDFCEKLYNAAIKNRALVVKGRFDTDQNLDLLILENVLNFNYAHTAGLYNRNFLLKNKILYPEDVKTGQDSVFLSRLVLKVKQIIIVEDTAYHYVRRDGSLDSKTLSDEKLQSRIKMLNYKIAMLYEHVFGSDSDRNLFIVKHIVEHFYFTFNKLSDAQKETAFRWLIDNKDILGIKNIATRFKPYQIKAINNKDFAKFIIPVYKTKLFYKERCANNLRNIYVLGKKIFSYTKKSTPEKIKNLNYKTYNDLAKDIKANIHKIPQNLDLIVGVPRSGMLPAYILGLALNKRVCSLQEFISGQYGAHGLTRAIDDSGDVKNVLIIDDSIDSGKSMTDTKKKVSALIKKYHCYFGAVYCSNKTSASMVDVPLVILSQPRVFQWNYLNHRIAEIACYDIDGVLCLDPSESENDDGEKYRQFLLNAKPLYIPKRKIAAIVTSRLEKWRPETEQWLAKQGIKYDKLYMLQNMTAEERRKKGVHAEFKAKIYKKLSNTSVFIESDLAQAKKIAELTGKMVFCATTDELF